MFGSSFFYYVMHLEGEEVFGSAKCPIDYPLGVENDSHRPNLVNFFQPWIIVHVAQLNAIVNVSMQ